ncbi:MAG: ATP-binding protein [Austwickia sp.]|nr:ATP-binding protein [Austwickia sp.]
MAWPSAAAATSAARLAVPSLPPRLAMAVVTVGAALFGWAGVLLIDPSNEGLSDCWGVDGIFLVAAALGWAQGPGRRWRGLLCYGVGAAAGFLVGGSVAGAGLDWLILRIPGNAAAGLCYVVLSQRGRPAGSFIPRNAEEAFRLMLVILPAPMVGMALGAYPATGLGGSGDLHTDLWGLARQFSALAVTANVVIPFFFRSTWRPAGSRTRWWFIPVFLVVASGAVTVPRLLPELPLAWLFIVPAALAGLLFPVRAAALAGFALVMIFVMLPYQRFPGPIQDATISPEILADCMHGFLSNIALTIAVFRENLMCLRVEAADRARTERARHELLDGVIQSISHGLLLADPEGRVTISNDAAERLVGTAIPDRVSSQWARSAHLQAADVMRVLDTPSWEAVLKPRPQQRFRGEVVVDSPSTATRRVSLTSQMLTIGADRLSLILFRDITAAHQRQQELETFAGTVAHDLKGPLTAMVAWMEAADDEFETGAAASGQDMLERAREAVFRMQALIDDYLAYAVTRGGVLTLTEVPLALVVAEIVDVYAGDGEHSATSFEVDVPHVLHADAALTRQLMANIIGNGVKYARDGEAAYLRIRSVDDAPGWAQVQVADAGRGLEPGDEERIFAEFSRGTRDAGSVAGIGLGLALCHSIVTRHGGRIWAENNDWGGATFRFTMPTVEAAQP